MTYKGIGECRAITLTNSAVTGTFDNVNGTSGNDTILGGPGFLETGDVINGGAGTDVLEARLTSGQTSAPTISGVENFFIRSDLAVDTTFSLNDVTGASQVWADRVTDTDGGNDDGLIVSGAGLTTAVTVGVKGGTSTAANRADVDFVFSGVSGTADTATLALDGAAVSDVVIAGIETLNIATTSETANRIDGILTVANASKLVVTGAANITIDGTDFANTGYEVDASAYTGNLNITLEDQASGKVKFVGGSGDDTVLLGAGLDTNDDIDGGAGTNAIGVGTAADLTATTGALLKNFQVFDAAGSAVGTYDMSHIDGGGSSSTITSVRVSANVGGAVVIDKLVDTGSVTVNATTTASLQVNQAGAGDAGSNSDSITYTLASPGTTGDLTVAALITPDVETVNIVSSATAGQTAGHTLTLGTFAAATTVKFSGDEQLTVTNLTAGAAASIDASAMTDKFIMTNAFAGGGIQLVQGGSAADTLVSNGVAGSTLQGNAGADTITLAVGGTAEIVKYLAATDSTLSAFDKISTFVTGEDKIDLKAFGFTGAQAIALDKGAATAVDPGAANYANFFNDVGVDRGVAWVTFGGNEYIYVDANKDGDFSADGDLVIELTGITNLAGGDFTFA